MSYPEARMRVGPVKDGGVQTCAVSSPVLAVCHSCQEENDRMRKAACAASPLYTSPPLQARQSPAKC